MLCILSAFIHVTYLVNQHIEHKELSAFCNFSIVYVMSVANEL